jgi:hypothetical protein
MKKHKQLEFNINKQLALSSYLNDMADIQSIIVEGDLVGCFVKLVDSDRVSSVL